MGKKTKAQVVARFGGYLLREDASLAYGARDWNITGATATFQVGPYKYGKSTANAVMFGVMASATDNTECFVTVSWQDGSNITMGGLARTSYADGQYMAKTIRDMSGVDPQQVQQQTQAYWNPHTNRWELNGQYWNGSAWELI